MSSLDDKGFWTIVHYFKLGDMEPIPQVGDQLLLDDEEKIRTVYPCDCSTVPGKEQWPKPGWEKTRRCGPHTRREPNRSDMRAWSETSGWQGAGCLYREETSDAQPSSNPILCPQCSTLMDWINMALKCPNCWFVK